MCEGRNVQKPTKGDCKAQPSPELLGLGKDLLGVCRIRKVVFRHSPVQTKQTAHAVSAGRRVNFSVVFFQLKAQRTSDGGLLRLIFCRATGKVYREIRLAVRLWAFDVKKSEVRGWCTLCMEASFCLWLCRPWSGARRGAGLTTNRTLTRPDVDRYDTVHR